MSTPILPFAIWMSGTNQNSIPANDNSLRNQILNGLVIADDVTAQPVGPADGDIYIIPGSATGTQWATFDEFDLAIFSGGTWYAFAPVAGVVVNLDGSLVAWDGSAYQTVGGGGGPVAAEDVSITDAGGYFTSTDVEGALQELGAGMSGGGASIGVQYVSDTGSTGDSDPGPGLMKWNNGTQGSATVLYLDDDTDDGVSMTGFWAALDANGFAYLQHATDQDTWQIWEITAVTDATGYVKLTVSLLANGGSFADGDPMLVTLQQGATGGGGSLTGFTSSLDVASPNNTVNVSALTASGGTTNQHAALIPKGTGGVIAAIPTSTSAGGNIRGSNSVDLQTQRSTAAQVASGAASGILSGENNLNAGADSVIPGGIGNSITAGNCNTIGGGTGNAEAGDQNTIGGGKNNTIATGTTSATIAGGETGTLTGANHSGITNGKQCTGTGLYSRMGGQGAQDRGVSGTDAYSGVVLAANGDVQGTGIVLGCSTANATPKRLTSTGGSASASTQITLPNGSAYRLKGMASAREAATLDAKFWDVDVCIRRGANAAATALVGSATVTSVANTGAGTTAWAIAITADTTTGCLAVECIGEASKTIKWGLKFFDIQVVG